MASVRADSANFIDCDMMEGNESKFTNIVFEISAWKEFKILLFYVVFNFDNLLITL